VQEGAMMDGWRRNLKDYHNYYYHSTLWWGLIIIITSSVSTTTINHKQRLSLHWSLGDTTTQTAMMRMYGFYCFGDGGGSGGYDDEGAAEVQILS